MLWDMGKAHLFTGEETEAQRSSPLLEVCLSSLVPRRLSPKATATSARSPSRTWAPAPVWPLTPRSVTWVFQYDPGTKPGESSGQARELRGAGWSRPGLGKAIIS